MLISNILEWARGDKPKFRIVSENLSKLLNLNGNVVCSSLIDRSSLLCLAKEVFLMKNLLVVSMVVVIFIIKNRILKE